MKNKLPLILLIALFSCEDRKSLKTGLEGQLLPKFDLLLSDSTSWLNTSSIQTGKPIVLFYFSPYCPYCMAQTKVIIDNIDKLKNVQIYMVTNYPFGAMKSFS